MSRRITNTGGFYTFIGRGLGKPPAVAGALIVSSRSSDPTPPPAAPAAVSTIPPAGSGEVQVGGAETITRNG